jgi:hypothetical protein
VSLRRDNKTRPGQQFASASLDNEQRRLTMMRIKAGPGIRIRYEGDSIVIYADLPRPVGGGLVIPWVKELPDIPTNEQTTSIVYWATSTQIEGATGDGQLWTASTGDTRWYPLAKYTTEDGIPVA